jgi:hypothetical protein
MPVYVVYNTGIYHLDSGLHAGKQVSRIKLREPE